jgi:hypothetical protein
MSPFTVVSSQTGEHLTKREELSSTGHVFDRGNGEDYQRLNLKSDIQVAGLRQRWDVTQVRIITPMVSGAHRQVMRRATTDGGGSDQGQSGRS